MLLDQNGSLKRASCEFALRVAVGILRRSASFFFDANEHLGEEETFQFLPGLAIFADSNCTIESQFPESAID